MTTLGYDALTLEALEAAGVQGALLARVKKTFTRLEQPKLVWTVLTQVQWYDDNVTPENIFDVKSHKHWLSERPDYMNHRVFASLEAAKKYADEELKSYANVVGAGKWVPKGHNGYSMEAGLKASSYARDVIWRDHLSNPYEFQSYWQSVDLKAVES